MKKYLILLLSLISFIPFNVVAYSNKIIPGGENVGIYISSKGVLVVGFYEVDNKLNKNGLKTGDYITKIENRKVNNINDLVNLIDKYENNGNVKMTIVRNKKESIIDFKLIKKGSEYKTGLYVKDSIEGIGTLTYVDPTTNIYGCLGHEIIESNTYKKIEVKEGIIFKSLVSGIDRSVDGKPGTKNAKFYENNIYGDINKNTNVGIYGKYNKELNKNTVEVGKPEDLKLGKATIYTVLSTEEVNEYEINITKIDRKNKIKNIYFEITDTKLLEKTGGIVQGMSGSPIMQDNKIYGAVTHVVIENVKNGYGVFVTTMLEEGDKIVK